MSNKANGFRDLIAVIDLSTFRRLKWEKNMPFFLVSFLLPETMEPLSADPRSLLKGIIDKTQEAGWQAMAGAEFEVILKAIILDDSLTLE